MSSSKRVHLLTLGCARNDTDSDELAARLSAAGWVLSDSAEDSDAVLVNTCGFVDAAKKDSIDALIQASDLKVDGQVKAVVAVGCLAERYGKQLATDVPFTDAVLGFDSYATIGQTLADIVGGARIESHDPVDRRSLTPSTPALRQEALKHGSEQILRVRLDSKPYAPLKIASGCDRRCSFCAIPRFRGAYVSRRPTDIIAEAAWLSERGVKELFLVSENSTSYGKDLGDMNLLEALLPALASIDAIERIRVSYLQPAELRPGLVDAMVSTEKVAPYFDLSFQHASPSVLRRMRRFGGSEEFLGLINSIRSKAPEAGIRSNVIVGFPGETEADLETLCSFIVEARMDVVGVFGYSDEEDTEARGFEHKLPQREINRRVGHVASLVDEMVSQRAEDRVGQSARVIMESSTEGRTAFQGPEVDGVTTIRAAHTLAVGDCVDVTIVDSDGVDLIAEVIQI